MQLVHPSTHPFSSKANSTRPLKVHFKLPVIKKAAPTVFVTNTNAARVDEHTAPGSSAFPDVSSSTSIPFPSSPIPCPSRKRAISEAGCDSEEVVSGEADEPMDVDADETKGSITPFHRRIAHIDIVRRRSKSCLASSYFHSDSHSPRKFPGTYERPVAPAQPAEGPARKRLAVRRESMSSGTPTGKTVRKAKRVFADAQFLASLHSSISSQVRSRAENGMDLDHPDDYTTQDALLVERIWHTLVDMGYKPVPVEDTPSPSSTPIPSQSSSPDLARQAAERAARRTLAVSSPFSLQHVQDVPPMPSGDLDSTQLVAVLIMRHRDRNATRPRSASKTRTAGQPPSRSPLSATLLPLSESTQSPA